MNRKALLGLLAVTIAILGIGTGAAGAVTLHVANNGTDSATCGAVATPCRSISQAIANAAAKDRILVGPGRYGDLNGNGILGEPGEEPSSILVSRRLTLESEEGAGATVIDMSGLHIPVLAITAGAIGSVIGLPGKGFTLSAGGWGLSTESPFPGQLTISGNLAINNIEAGFLVHLPETCVLNANLSIRNGNGFTVHGGSGTLKNNTAVGNQVDGFVTDGGAVATLSNNVAIGNGKSGFLGGSVGGDPTSTLTYRGNSALGNGIAGMSFENTNATLSQNNIYSNAPATNCGLIVGFATTASAANNYWGAATGPGADPADDVCGSAVFTPFATKEFPISTTWK